MVKAIVTHLNIVDITKALANLGSAPMQEILCPSKVRFSSSSRMSSSWSSLTAFSTEMIKVKGMKFNVVSELYQKKKKGNEILY